MPNDERVLVKLAQRDEKEIKEGELILPSGNATVGDNTVRVCRIVHPGNSSFKEGQMVYAQEYSMMAVADYKQYLKGEITLSKLFDLKNLMYSVSRFDIIAYDDDVA